MRSTPLSCRRACTPSCDQTQETPFLPLNAYRLLQARCEGRKEKGHIRDGEVWSVCRGNESDKTRGGFVMTAKTWHGVLNRFLLQKPSFSNGKLGHTSTPLVPQFRIQSESQRDRAKVNTARATPLCCEVCVYKNDEYLVFLFFRILQELPLRVEEELHRTTVASIEDHSSGVKTRIHHVLKCFS